ncbi:hypothetical protein VTJ83DRAFT_2053 [Remersonia thermophila]|uniref:Uncharacterized protein n=1 Tax=Remersonia thermophila TaxID=72144 RepID=A0ABR4DIL5_9PEZI
MASGSPFHAITSRFSPSNILRRRSLSSSSTLSTSSRASSVERSPISRAAAAAAAGSVPRGHSPVNSIHSIILRRKSLFEEEQDEEERPLQILEPRPAMTFYSLEEMMSF